MSPKWVFLAHFGDISYNVFNRRKSSYFIIKPLDFIISESNHQKFIFIVSFLIIYKKSVCQVLVLQSIVDLLQFDHLYVDAY